MHSIRLIHNTTSERTSCLCDHSDVLHVDNTTADSYVELSLHLIFEENNSIRRVLTRPSELGLSEQFHFS